MKASVQSPCDAREGDGTLARRGCEQANSKFLIFSNAVLVEIVCLIKNNSRNFRFRDRIFCLLTVFAGGHHHRDVGSQ